MLSAGIIVFRETLEAAMILGILAAATVGVAASRRWLASGVAVGVLGAVAVAMLTERIGQWADGMGQELFNALILGIAVVMLGWHNIWMSRHGAEMAHAARSLGAQVSAGTRELSALLLVVALAVLREGSETVLFLYGTMASGSLPPMSVAAGGLLGLGGGAVVGFILYAGFLRIPVRWFFAATSGLILLLAAAMASQMARFLIQGDLLPDLENPLWDTSAWLPNQSPMGTFLHVLIGYEARPAGLQVAFYIAVVALMLFGMRVARSRPPVANRPARSSRP